MVEITRMSPNGQVVIPADIRRSANLKPLTQFLVLNENGNIILKKIEEKKIIEEMKLSKELNQSEEDIKEGKVIELDSKMSIKEMDKILMGA